MNTVPWITKTYAHLIGFIFPALVLLLIVDRSFLQHTAWNFDIWRLAAGAVILGLLLESALIQRIFNAFPGISTAVYRQITDKIREKYGKSLSESWALFENDLSQDARAYQVVTWRESMYNFFRNMAIFILIGLIVSAVLNPSGLTIILFILFVYCLAEARIKQRQLALILAANL